MGPWVRELLHRRVPQLVGLYLGASWGVLQFVDWLVKRYLLPDVLTDAVLLAVFSLAPAIVLLAWGHGAPGKDPWGKVEKIGVPVNLALTAVLLVMLLHGRELGATAQRVTVTDEQGQTVERVVPKQDHRRRMMLFYWANDTGDPSLDWLSYGLPTFLGRDLSQDPYLDVWTPSSGYNRNVFSRLQQAGFDDGLGVPIALQRQVASRYHLEYFVSGAFEQTTDGGERLKVDLHRVEPAATVANLMVEGEDRLELVDQLAVELKNALDVPTGSQQLADDLAVADHLSSSMEALREYVTGGVALFVENDHSTATVHFRQAAEIDPSFAVAKAAEALTLLNRGETQEALLAIEEALRHDYNLPERERFFLKAGSYWSRGQADKSIAVYEMWVDLFPDDTVALATLANQYQWNGNRLDDAIAVYERLLETAPDLDWVLSRLGQVWLAKGEEERALDFYRRYSELHPDEAGSWMRIAQIHLRRGELDKARELYERSELLARGIVGPMLAVADLDLRIGDLEAVEERIAQAEVIAANPPSQTLVVEARLELHEMRGELEAYVRGLPELEQVQRQYQSPTNVIADVFMLRIGRWVEAGQTEEALGLLDTLETQLEPPFDRFVTIGRMLVHLVAGNTEEAAEKVDEVQGFIEQFNRTDLMHYIESAHGHLALQRGEYDEAVRRFENGVASHQSSIQGVFTGSYRLRMLTDLGRAARLANRPDHSREQLEEVLKVFPSYPWAHLELALLENGLGNRDQAQHHLDRVFHFWEGADAGYPPALEARTLASQLARTGLEPSG